MEWTKNTPEWKLPEKVEAAYFPSAVLHTTKNVANAEGFVEEYKTRHPDWNPPQIKLVEGGYSVEGSTFGCLIRKWKTRKSDRLNEAVDESGDRYEKKYFSEARNWHECYTQIERSVSL